MRVFSHDTFYGTLHLTRVLPGLTCSHRLADSPPERIEVHTHLDAHFVLVTSGPYVSSARDGRGESSTLVYNPPGTTHRDHFLQGRGSFFTLTIAGGRLAEAVEAPLHPAAVYLSERRAAGLARALFMECARWTSASALRAESLCLELIGAASEQPVPIGKRPPSWLDLAIERIADSPTDDMAVADIAREVHVHPTHLARVFRAFVGCTPGDYLRARRLDRAASLLLETNRPITRIALDCGFADQPQLTRSFTRTFGMPPDAFRRGGRKARVLHFDKTVRSRYGRIPG